MTSTKFSFVEVWFTNQKQLEIEDNVCLTLSIGQILRKYDIQLNQDIENMLKDMAFCHLQENLEINMVKNYWILQQKQEQMFQKLHLKEQFKNLQKQQKI